MLFSITTTRNPATDLGFLLQKHPERIQTFELAFGKAHVFYPEISPERCTATLLLDVDPVGLVRKNNPDDFALRQYVNDRPYVASSMLSVAISKVFGTALSGNCKQNPELAETPIPLEFRIPALPATGDGDFIRRLFAPLGYEVEFTGHPLDPNFPEWGQSRIFSVTLRGNFRLQDALSHLYVLIPALDGDKHYFIGEAEVEKLLRHGEGWLAEHPERETIAKRYLKKRGSLVRAALERLSDGEETVVETDSAGDAEEAAVEKPLSLNERRMAAVVKALLDAGASSVVDLGCGEGKLLTELVRERRFSKIVGVDVSPRSLDIARDRLKIIDDETARLRVFQSSLTYRDARLTGFDAAAVIEVVEHLDADRLDAFRKFVFREVRPKTVVLTTPNGEYNAKFGLPAGRFRHRDHRFEWTRAEFQQWVDAVGEEFGYSATISFIGDEDETLGAPTQMAVFLKDEG